jgi:hypothetical protein
MIKLPLIPITTSCVGCSYDHNIITVVTSSILLERIYHDTNNNHYPLMDNINTLIRVSNNREGLLLKVKTPQNKGNLSTVIQHYLTSRIICHALYTFSTTSKIS